MSAGELIVFERVVTGTDERDLYAIGPNGGEPTLVRSPGGYPHWSPDGSQLAFFACLDPPKCGTAAGLLDRSSGEVRGVSAPDPGLEAHCAIWAPSGDRLACEGLDEKDPTRNGVYSLRASDGTALIRVTQNPRGDDFPLAYSPDGSQLLLDRMDPSRSASADHALFVTSTHGGPARRVTPWGLSDDYASWSPGGGPIVFGTGGLLYRVSPDGHGLAVITPKTAHASSRATAFDVSFSPDGSRIVFSLGNPDPGIYTARVDGSDVRRLTTSPTEDHHASWGAAAHS